MPAKKRNQTRIVSASAVEKSAGLTFGLPSHHLKMFRQKINTHKLLSTNHPYYRIVAKTSLARTSDY